MDWWIHTSRTYAQCSNTSSAMGTVNTSDEFTTHWFFNQMHIHRSKHNLMKRPWHWHFVQLVCSRSLWHEVWSGYRYISLQLSFQISYAIFKHSWRRFLSRSLNALFRIPLHQDEYPLKRAELGQEKLLSVLVAFPRCDEVAWVPPVSSSLCHSLTASRRATKLFHHREGQFHSSMLLSWGLSSLPCFYVSKWYLESYMLHAKPTIFTILL